MVRRQRRKGGDNLGFSGRKALIEDKVVASCSRPATVALFICPWQSEQSPLLEGLLPQVTR